MKILVIGAGGREHALAWKLGQSARAELVYSCVKAAAGGKVKYISYDLSDNAKILEFCKDNPVDLAVIGPEAPLAAGAADALLDEGVKVFGPVKAGARLESSKDFSKAFMQKYGIPTAAYGSFTDIEEAKEYVEQHGAPIVIKADGLAAGKGVRVCMTKEDALLTLEDFMSKAVFGAAGSKVVIEEFLEGREASVMALTDGESFKILPVSRDHKRLLDGNNGPNTGGMGVYCPVTDITPSDMEYIKTNVFERTLAGLKAENINYCGVLYAGIMKGPKGIKVLEFNCRFGDPETQTVLPLLNADLLEIMLACTDKNLKPVEVPGTKDASVCVILAGKDYPASGSKGLEITGLDKTAALVFHSGTKEAGGKFYTNGGRVLAVVQTAADIAQAREKVYKEITKIHFDGMQYRTDIGK